MDLGHKLTDEALAKLEKKIKSAYKLANDEIEQYFAEFDEKSKAQKAKFENGEITEQEYKRWRLNEATKGKHYKAIQKSIAEQMNNADKIAVDYINGSMPDIYALNRNYAAYSIEQADLSASFDLVDGSTVKRLIEEDPKLLPNYPPEKAIDFAENSKYFQKQVTKQVTTGILLGESNEDIALRLIKNIPDMGKVSAVRNARTATTSAECAGRQDTYMAAKNMGIVLKKEWQSAHDARTRDAHIAADGQKVEVEQPFIVGGERLMNPGDPSGSAWNIMNCRCTTVADIDTKASAKNKNPVSFNKWVEQKQTIGTDNKLNFATVKEAEEWITKSGVDFTILDGFDLETANIIANAVNTLPEGVKPKSITNLQYFKKGFGSLKPFGRKDSEIYGVTIDNLWGINFGNGMKDIDGGIMVAYNSRNFKNAKAISLAKKATNEKYKERTGRMWHFNMSGEATYYHEIGHSYAQKKGIPQGFSEARQRWYNDSKCDILQTDSEAWAEAWAAYYLKDKRLPDYIAEFIKGAK